MTRNCIVFSYHAAAGEFFAKGLLVAIRSVRLTNPGVPIVVLHDGLSAAEGAALDGCRLVHVDGQRFGVDHRPDLTPATFFKFSVAALEGFDRVLYLDSDLVVLDSLDALFDTSGVLAARRQPCDLTEDYTEPGEVIRREGMRNDGPFLNGGVVCFDRRFWTEKRLLDEAIQIGAEYGWAFFKNADQGILNILAHRHGGFTELPVTYNYCRWPDMVASSGQRLARNRRGWLAPMVLSDTRQRWLSHPWARPFVRGPLAKIVHWNGPLKPWELDDESDRRRFVSACYDQLVSAASPQPVTAAVAASRGGIPCR